MEPVSRDNLEVLEKTFNGVVVKQLTPKRILFRKKEHLRHRRVYEVKTKYLTENVFETIIRADGGLYIKELISSDEGRTTPSFTEVLGVQAYCIELDVIAVI